LRSRIELVRGLVAECSTRPATFSNPLADGEADCNADADAYAEANCNRDAYAYPGPVVKRACDANADTNSNTEPDANSHTDPDPDPDANSHADADADANTNAYRSDRSDDQRCGRHDDGGAFAFVWDCVCHIPVGPNRWKPDRHR
jgi:hypothetical protein